MTLEETVSSKRVSSSGLTSSKTADVSLGVCCLLKERSVAEAAGFSLPEWLLPSAPYGSGLPLPIPAQEDFEPRGRGI